MADRAPLPLSRSGQQRVALASDGVRQKVLLFSEPLSGLDAKLRVRVRSGRPDF